MITFNDGELRLMPMPELERIAAEMGDIPVASPDFDFAMRLAKELFFRRRFRLANDPPPPKRLKTDNNDHTRQRVLIEGLDCLPGQKDLF